MAQNLSPHEAPCDVNSEIMILMRFQGLATVCKSKQIQPHTSRFHLLVSKLRPKATKTNEAQPFGCNFADHQMWSLHKGGTPNNLAGIEEEASWTGSSPPELDPMGPTAPGSTCACADPQASSYNLHLLYDPTNTSTVTAKDGRLYFMGAFLSRKWWVFLFLAGRTSSCVH